MMIIKNQLELNYSFFPKKRIIPNKNGIQFNEKVYICK